MAARLILSRLRNFRSQGRIAAPEVITVPSDLIYAWSKSERGKLGGQSKIPHIDPTPDAAMIMSLKRYSAGAGEMA